MGHPSITPALISRCYDEPSGLFRPAVMPAISSRIPLTVAALSPLALPDLPDEIGHRLADYLFAWSALALELLDPANAGAGVPVWCSTC